MSGTGHISKVSTQQRRQHLVTRDIFPDWGEIVAFIYGYYVDMLL